MIHKTAERRLTCIQQYDEISRDIFGDNYSKLAKLKAEFDPHNMFSKLFAIEPDLMAAQIGA